MNTTPGAPAVPDRSRPRIAFFLILLGVAVALVVLARVFAPDGHEHAPLGQFFGRFHPVAVHVPIGLILLVPVFEIWGAGRSRTFLRQSATLLLSLATFAAVASAALGLTLAYSGGFAGELVAQHLKGGVVFAVASLAAVACRARWAATNTGAWRWAYGLALAFSLISVTWAAHVGGQITHGESYLSELMPQPFRGWLAGADEKKVAPPPSGDAAQAVYFTHIQPIFDDHCTSCHKAGKVKGGLRLDSFAELMKGGDDVEGRSDGQVVVAGNPVASDLYRRITLPPDDDDAMPSNGKPPLTAPQIRLIEWWIIDGASATTTPATATYLPPDVRAILAEPRTAPSP